jgi:hypothetical protein
MLRDLDYLQVVDEAEDRAARRMHADTRCHLGEVHAGYVVDDERKL